MHSLRTFTVSALPAESEALAALAAPRLGWTGAHVHTVSTLFVTTCWKGLMVFVLLKHCDLNLK